MQNKNELRTFFLRNRIAVGGIWLLFLLLWLLCDDPIFLTVCASIPVLIGFSLLSQAWVLRHMTMAIRMPDDTVQKDACIGGTICVENRARLPMHRCFLELESRNTYTHETQTQVLSAGFARRETTHIHFETRAKHCGFLTCTVRSVRSTDIFGVFALRGKQRAVSDATPIFPDVYPVTLSITPRTVSDCTQEDATMGEKGADLSLPFQLRGYVPGDSLRQIHWKLSEKTDTLIVREGSAPMTDTLLVYWDPSDSVAHPDAADAVAAAVASVCCALCDSGVRFRFVHAGADLRLCSEAVTAEELHLRILEAIRTDTPTPQPMPPEMDRERGLYFSVHRPQDAGEWIGFHCDAEEGQAIRISPDRPPKELELCI